MGECKPVTNDNYLGLFCPSWVDHVSHQKTCWFDLCSCNEFIIKNHCFKRHSTSAMSSRYNVKTRKVVG
jgi:hypothetical protein